MPNLQKKPTLSRHLWVIYLLSIVLLGVIWYYQWMLGIIMTLFMLVSFYYSIRTEKTIIDETERYITTLSHRLKKVGEEALLEMPIGIVLFSENYQIEWTNTYMNDLSEGESLLGKPLDSISDDLIPIVNEDKEDAWIEIDGYNFQVTHKKDERLLYLFDRTEQRKIQTLYQSDRTVLLIIYLDNYEEITQNMDDTLKSQLNSEVTSVLNNWSHECGLYLKRTSQDRFLAIGNNKILNQLEEKKFAILDYVRELHGGKSNPVTLSIGVGHGEVDLPVLGELAQSSLDLALGRGGDQVTIKDDEGRVRFYGGKTNPMEKRTRVRARVISHALKELIKSSDEVIIMGHKSPDMDALGAAIGILKIAQANEVDGFIVFDPDDIDTGVFRLVDAIKDDNDLWQHFIDPEEAHDKVSKRSLVVVVDTNKPSMVADERLLSKADYKVVIDHHRRGEDFIENPTLVYMEPYASSTAELVTELIEYQPKVEKLSTLEATALLAGITVDTKNFTLRTGSRTFDAASFLRSRGADTIKVQEFLKEDLDLYIRKSKLIEGVEIYRDNIAIAAADPGDVFGSVLIAQTADTLLMMDHIEASFVISEREDGGIRISARSLGALNVQVIMEKMHGGGHLTNAATQINEVTIDEAKEWLKEILDNHFEGSE